MPDSVLHFDIMEKLGEGGMGVVYLARDTRLDRRVALKFLPRYISGNDEERRRFRIEAQSAARLNHPHIAQVYSIEETEEELFIVMEYVEGKELREVIAGEELTMERRAEVALQIARALQAAHEKGIIHRDIKSSNIMLDNGGRVKVMDFGLARMQGSEHITRPGSTLGTTAYMSPEQLAGYDLDPRSDIWSYGVVLYELFSGRLPFRGAYDPALMYAIAEEEPEPLEASGGHLPDGVETVIAGCLVKDREKRYPDMEAVISDLEEGAEASGAPGRGRGGRTGRAGAVARLGIRRRAAAFLSVVLLLALAFWLVPWSGSQGVPGRKYLAVLPIESIGGDTGVQAICDGLAETLSYRLSELEQFDPSYWVAPASELRRERIQTAAQANRRFGVNLAVLSTVQEVGDSLRLIMELVDADQVRRLDSEQVTVHRGDLAALEQGGVRAMLSMMQIDVDSRMTRMLQEGAPSNPQAYEWYLKGMASLQHYASQDSLDSAIRLFREAVAADTGFALAYAGIGEASWRKYETTRSASYLEQAKRALDEALLRGEELPRVQELKGRLSAGTGDHVQAIMHFTRALEMDPRYHAAYRGLARVYDAQGQPDKAVDTYRRAIELKPDYWEGYKDLGIHFLGKGRYGDAVEQFRQVTRLTPQNATAWSNLGVAYYYDGQGELARQMMEHSLELEPNPLTANNLAGFYYWDGLYAEAAAQYEVVLEDLGDRYDIWANLAAAYHWSGEEEKSQEAYRQAIRRAEEQLQVNPGDAQVMADLGGYYADLADTARALSWIRKATALTPQNVRVRHRAVFVYEKSGMRDEALEWIQPSMLPDIESQPEFRELVADPAYGNLKEQLLAEEDR
ncbi:MAG: protein kinase [Balneolaceae bacterium]|nr:protein kinase [Balneolaceae bacterium]